MNAVEKIRDLLNNVGMPEKQQSDLCCYTVLAMAGLTNKNNWASATNNWVRIHDIIAFIAKEYGKYYAENSRETFRKQAIHHFRTAALIEDNNKPTNSPLYRYRLTKEFLDLIQKNADKNAMTSFLSCHDRLVEIYASKKTFTKIPVKINGRDFSLSIGKHNQLQKAILEQFAPRFAPGTECLYMGDTTKKDLYKNDEKLKEIGFEITLHDKMPDIVLYDKSKDWLYFIESVTSVGPMSANRVLELQNVTSQVRSGKIFVTAFLDFKNYKKFSDLLSWDTEVWIAELPDHMIHLNGNKFLGPR